MIFVPLCQIFFLFVENEVFICDLLLACCFHRYSNKSVIKRYIIMSVDGNFKNFRIPGS